MRSLLGVVGLIAVLAMAPAVAQPTLRLVADKWPPFSDSSLPGGGLATGLVSAALARAGYASEFEEVPWARALMGVGEGRYDVLINAWYTESRTQLGEFSSPYLSNRIRLLGRKDRPFSFTQLADLYPYSIAVVRDYAYSPAFDSDSRLDKVPVRGFSSAIRMLAAGRVDLAVEDELVARYLLQYEPPEVRGQVDFVAQPLGENSLHILVSLKNPQHDQIVQGFDRAIQAMKADGSYARIMRQYGF
ncbi:transporter substrate-binding domain-containing protein [uncultured Pseudomonas sp.]|uniref:substrate-binding periplasmic protein n=1 Tax=uncultured Pseudomonas sp. TaxID=114707 RepID=UPI0025F98215|nr:transporter substrate-binding domain-containing protein [uncultured Pseudomonas sp.]